AVTRRLTYSPTVWANSGWLWVSPMTRSLGVKPESAASNTARETPRAWAWGQSSARNEAGLARTGVVASPARPAMTTRARKRRAKAREGADTQEWIRTGQPRLLRMGIHPHCGGERTLATAG